MSNDKTTEAPSSISVLVAVEDYPGSTSGKSVSHRFVHVRNLYYRDFGIDVTVLNFSERDSYVFEGIRVIGPKEYERQSKKYDLLLCHQPNLKHHLPLCKRHMEEFEGVVFFFHGHEVLKMSAVYPRPYEYMGRNLIKRRVRDAYDIIKFRVLRRFFAKVRNEAAFVFVSQWMYDEFMKWLRVDKGFLGDRAFIIPNCIGTAFEEGEYHPIGDPEFDFVTVRSNLDTSKYAIDLVVESARANEDLRYLIIGKGQFFKHVNKPDNVTWVDATLSHDQVVGYLNRSRCALMPTRTDAQGLMMCEMASFGIPVITSDIPVCHEVLDNFNNVCFVGNEGFGCDFGDLIPGVLSCSEAKASYHKVNTIGREVRLMRDIMQEDGE